MDFFGEQDRAKAKTGQLWFLFLCAVFLIVTSLSLVIVLGLSYSGMAQVFLRIPSRGQNFQDISQLLNAIIRYGRWENILVVPLCLTGFILSVSFFKYLVIAQKGGSYIAKMLGGTKLEEASSHEEKKLLNIVEEMALASGIAVPEVYILKNQNEINAFAAGTNLHQAVIGVSQGAIAQLSRDELQGVIAHEFSHIFHGDMKINAQLIGVLHGILFIHEFGASFLRHSRYRRSRSRRDKGDGAFLAIMFGFMVIGLIGYFFGSLIKAAISRQREFLADAAAVQYTRNPAGISMALAKIGNFGSLVDEKKASQASHMFFANGLKSPLEWFATHPPLSTRINQIGYLKIPQTAKKEHYAHIVSGSTTKSSHAVSQFVGDTGSEQANNFNSEQEKQQLKGNPFNHSTSEELITNIGSVSKSGLDRARKFIASLPDNLRDAAHNHKEVVFVLYSIGISLDEKYKSIQSSYIRKIFKAEEAGRIFKYHDAFSQLGKGAIIPILEIACSTLRSLKSSQKMLVVSRFIKIIESKKRVGLLDYLLIKILETNLDENYLPRVSKKRRENHKNAKACIISALAHYGSSDKDTFHLSYVHGVKELNLGSMYLQKIFPWDINRFDRSIRSLNSLSHLQKKSFIEACAKVVSVDGIINENELIVLKGICDCLGCPSPFF